MIFQGQKPCLEKLEEVHKTLQSYEEYLDKNEFMAGDHLTLAGGSLSTMYIVEQGGPNFLDAGPD